MIRAEEGPETYVVRELQIKREGSICLVLSFVLWMCVYGPRSYKQGVG